MGMEWTREKTLMLISAYRDRRGLWDMTCDDYRKKDVKLRLLTEVRNSLSGDIPIPEIEKKFHTLRTQYHREISRIKRKEPYNSKWFGFKNLQFLSSPRACRSNKGRVKSEITEEGTVTKYIITEPVASAHDSSGGSSSVQNETDEFISISATVPPPRKLHATRSAQELEKLIEETTKDVDDIEDAKPKLIIKDMNVPYEQNYTTETVQEVESDALESQNHQTHHLQTQHSIDEVVDQQTPVETVSFQANENGELYQSTTSSTISGNNTSVHHVLPTRIFKYPRRDQNVGQDESYYTEALQHQHQQQQQQQQLQQPKRYYYDTSQSTTTILATPTITSTPNGASTIINPTTLKLPRGTVCVGPPPKILNESSTSSASATPRDEFSTYGEYIANEIRTITNREVLIALKHKINTAIFEANMAELQK